MDSSRRSLLTLGAATATVGTIGSILSSTPVSAATAGGFAPPPTGGDDSSILRDAALTGKVLGAGTYLCKQPLDLPQATLLGLPGLTWIKVQAPSFIDSTGQWTGPIFIQGIMFEGDPTLCDSLIRNRYTGSNVNYHKIIQDCSFRGYRRAAISLNQTDNPYVTIQRCIFWGANCTTSVGVALSGGNDNAKLTGNAFLYNKINIALLGGGGAHVRITENDFIQYGPGSNRIGVWVVPVVGLANSGPGLLIRDNKFGNENRSPDDYAILYAEQGAALSSGAKYAGDYGPKLAASNGYVALQEISSNDFSGAGASQREPIVTWTPNFISNRIGPNVHSGTTPKTEVLFAGHLPTTFTGTVITPGRNWYPTMASQAIAPTNAPSNTYTLLPG